MARYSLVLLILLISSGSLTHAQMLVNKDQFTKAFNAVLDARADHFNSIISSPAGDEEYLSKVMLPGSSATRIYHNNGLTYFSSYSFHDSLQARRFFRQLKELITTAEKNTGLTVRFAPEHPDSTDISFYLADSIGYREFHNSLRIDKLADSSLSADDPSADVLPASLEEASPFAVHLFISDEPFTANYFVRKGARQDTAINRIVNDIGFGNDPSMNQAKGTPTQMDGFKQFTSSKTLKGYTSSITEVRSGSSTINSFILERAVHSTREAFLVQVQNMVDMIQSALPSDYAYSINTGNTIDFFQQPFHGAEKDADFTLAYWMDKNDSELFHLSFTIRRRVY